MERKRGKGQAVYVTGKEQKELVKRDFYKFQKRVAMRSDLEQLKESFEADKKRMQKAIDKDSRRAAR